MPDQNRIKLVNGIRQVVARSPGEAVLLLRKQLHLTQKELAERAHIDRASVSKVERGTLNPTVKWMTDLANSVGYIAELHFVKKDGGDKDVQE